eukprot:gene3087-3979_t
MANCEIDKCNAHAGQGFDYHYHGDPFHPVNGTCMYSAVDYASATVHPPQIGFALDGFDVYGRHLTTTNLGYSTALDQCGGHIHNLADGTAMPYHYHAQVLNMTISGKAYTAYTPGVLDCFRGNFTKNRLFFGNSVPAEQRPDYELTKACCGMTNYVTDKGFKITGAGTQSTTTSAPTASP